ncbi:MAG: carboxypeptidase M32 [Candidatus Bruticola sp.]
MGKAYESLLKKVKEINCLNEILELLTWDLETGMPVGADEARAEQMAVVSELAHKLSVSAEYLTALHEAEAEFEEEKRQGEAQLETSPYSLSNFSVKADLLRRLRRSADKDTKVPASVAAELTAACSKAQSAWMKARQNNDFDSFCGPLERVIELCRAKAEALGGAEHPYDALLDIYEPGLTASQVSRVFGELRGHLISLVKRIAQADPPKMGIVNRLYPVDMQRRFCHRLMCDMGYDWTRGKVDEVIHPFCCSFSTRDVRVTNNFSENVVTKALFTALHETGHALYEQGSPAEWTHTPLEGGASMAVHESESRLWENIIGRSRAFWEYYFPIFQAYFPAQTSGTNLDEFYQAINCVTPSFIRTEADEVTYSLHVMLRFELEKALIEGSLKAKDLPEAWNSAMSDYLGIVPFTDSEGCLQDVHWSSGLFGYFPAYALGNLIGAQTWQALKLDLGDTDEILRCGKLGLIRQWLHDHIYVYGQRLYPAELLKRALGKELEAAPFVDYLERKYTELYHL